MAGQIPPPDAGQFAATLALLDQLERSSQVDVEHVPFRFSTGTSEFGRIRVAKVLEFPRIWARFLAARLRGSIDLVVYPLGGPQISPTVRDIAVLPVILLVARGVVLQMHAGGYAEAWSDLGPVRRVARWLYRRTAGVVVMTEFNRRDPAAIGLSPVFVARHQIPDVAETVTAYRRPPGSTPIRLLYVGMLSVEKGVPALVEAVGRLSTPQRPLGLTLVGEPFGSLTDADIAGWAAAAGIADGLELTGRLVGDAKWKSFLEADLFVFPSIHPTESFGLVLVEAMMFGLPIVATRWRGNPDVLGDPIGGVWCEPGDDLAGALHTAIGSALDRRDLWDAWGASNRERFESHYRQRTASAMVELVERLAAGSRS